MPPFHTAFTPIVENARCQVADTPESFSPLPSPPDGSGVPLTYYPPPESPAPA
jgi:hypothetical protein